MVTANKAMINELTAYGFSLFEIEMAVSFRIQNGWNGNGFPIYDF